MPDDVRLQIEKFERTFHRLAVCMYSYAGNYARAESLVKRLKKKVKFKHNSAAQYATLFLWKCGMSEDISIARSTVLPETCLANHRQLKLFYVALYVQGMRGRDKKAHERLYRQPIYKALHNGALIMRSEYSPRTDNIYALMINCCRAKRKNKALHLYKELRTSFDRRSKGRKGFVESKAPDKGTLASVGEFKSPCQIF